MNLFTASDGVEVYPAKSVGFSIRPRADMTPKKGVRTDFMLANSGAKDMVEFFDRLKGRLTVDTCFVSNPFDICQAKSITVCHNRQIHTFFD